MNEEIYIIDTLYSKQNPVYTNRNDGFSGLCSFFIVSPLLVYGITYIYDNSDLIYNQITNWGNTIYAWALGTRRYDRFNNEVFRPLDAEYGKKIININGIEMYAEGYYNKDVIRGPGKINIYTKPPGGLIEALDLINDKEIETKGIYRDNMLYGPGTYRIRHYSKKDNEEDSYGLIDGTYTGNFRNNNLHGTGKFENDYISVEGEFKEGFLLEGTITIKIFNERYMDYRYINKNKITGKFSGKDYFSKTAYVDYFELDGPGEMELSKPNITHGFYKLQISSIHDKGTFKNGRLNGTGTSFIKVDGRTYTCSGQFKNGRLENDSYIENNNVKLRMNLETKIMNIFYPSGDELEVDKELENFTIRFESGDIVKGKILNNTLIKEIRDIWYNPYYELNQDELNYFITNIDDFVYERSNDRIVKDLNKLEFMYWMCSKNRELYEYLSNKNPDITGEIFISLNNSEDFKNEIFELQNDYDTWYHLLKIPKPLNNCIILPRN